MKLPAQKQHLKHLGQVVFPASTGPMAVQASALTGKCYIQYNCPEDDLIGEYTKRECQTGGGYSWMNLRGRCENFR